MEYQTWISIIEKLKNGTIDIGKLNQLKEAPINNNINDLLIPKLEELINYRFEKIVRKITSELVDIFNDVNYLDITLVNLKKELNFLIEIINLKQINPDKQKELKKNLINNTNQIYDILIKEAKRIDYTGVFEITISNNKIKWSDENEL